MYIILSGDMGFTLGIELGVQSHYPNPYFTSTSSNSILIGE